MKGCISDSPRIDASKNGLIDGNPTAVSFGISGRNRSELCAVGDSMENAWLRDVAFRRQ